MEYIDTLIVGAGISGLAVANFLSSHDYLVLEAETEIGGYCKTIKRGPFVWDYSGHFFHFQHPEIKRYLVDRIPPAQVRTIVKCARILFGDRLVDFPFQKNIHQLPRQDFIDCLYELFFRDDIEVRTFKDMLAAKFGRGICERFLFPYNEKLYACELSELDIDAMGRFFPHADLRDIIRNFKRPDPRSYNATFTYPKGGAFEYIKALKSTIPDEQIALHQPLLELDLSRHIAVTSKREIEYGRLISSVPFNRLLAMTHLDYDPLVFSSNKVLVFNLGFDRKGWDEMHWVYVPERKYSFYRVGFYDNIFGTDQMSLYIEIGLPTRAIPDIEKMQQRVLADLSKAGIITDHQLVASHNVILDPAYVHITARSQHETARLTELLNREQVFSIGRYGGWTYCSIEDNIVEAIGLVERLENRKIALDV